MLRTSHNKSRRHQATCHAEKSSRCCEPQGLISNGNVVITGGSFSVINKLQAPESGGFIGWNTLVQSISMDFFHNSASRCNSSRSLDDQYGDVKSKLMNIITGDDAVRRVVWIHGSSQTSEIAQSVADSCSELSIRPVSFFGGGITQGNDEQYALFIPIIAYQLCLLIPEARHLVGKAVEFDPAILLRSPLDQLRELIITPLTQLARSQNYFRLHHRPLIILDGLHKFGPTHQRQLTHAVLNAADEFPLPAAFMVFSKPSTNIRNVFHCPRETYFTEIAIAESGIYTCCTSLYGILYSAKILLALLILLFGVAISSISSMYV